VVYPGFRAGAEKMVYDILTLGGTMKTVEIDGQIYPVTVLPPYEGPDEGYQAPRPVLCVHERPEPAVAEYLDRKYQLP
jgi:hypothetical protein